MIGFKCANYIKISLQDLFDDSVPGEFSLHIHTKDNPLEACFDMNVESSIKWILVESDHDESLDSDNDDIDNGDSSEEESMCLLKKYKMERQCR